jgi:hypothetical protein
MISFKDYILEAQKAETVTVSSKKDLHLGKFSDGIAVIEQKKAKKSQVVFETDAAERKEFGKGLAATATLCRIQTPFSVNDDQSHRTICAIDAVNGTITFIDMDKYEDTEEVKWEKGLKFTFLNILDTKAKYFGVK